MSFFSSISLFLISMIFLINNLSVILIFNLSPLLSSFLSISLVLDWTSSFFSACILFISSSIFIFSSSYIPKKEQKRFMIILLTFIISMIILTFSNNIFFLMLGWDGLGISSYILVIFYQNTKSSESGIITILSNRIGDIFIIISISLLSFLGLWELNLNNLFPSFILFLICLAAFTKSAQTPFSAWLPAAMAAPTPISALVHSSTLVTAGIFILIRLLSFPHPYISFFILISSSITMIFASISANWEQDCKKIIALSTLSQIAMMAFSISINCPLSALFHLITHAFFKSTIFLCAGSLIHNSNYQDLRSQGAFISPNPFILISFNTANMALMGIPFLSGFFSKDQIIEQSISNFFNPFIFSLLFISIGLTSSYSSRLISSSSLMILKHHKDKNFETDLFMFFSILILLPFSIILGCILSWINLPSQILIIPFFLKLLILISIALGILIGFSLSFKSKSFLLLGNFSSSLWFMNSISSFLPILSTKIGYMSQLSDKTLMEFSSAQSSFEISKLSSPLMNIFISKNLIPISIFIIPPLSFLLSFLFSLK